MGPLAVFVLGGAAGYLVARNLHSAYRKGVKAAAGVGSGVARAAAQAREDYEDALAEIDEDQPDSKPSKRRSDAGRKGEGG